MDHPGISESTFEIIHPSRSDTVVMLTARRALLTGASFRYGTSRAFG